MILFVFLSTYFLRFAHFLILFSLFCCVSDLTTLTSENRNSAVSVSITDPMMMAGGCGVAASFVAKTTRFKRVLSVERNKRRTNKVIDIIFMSFSLRVISHSAECVTLNKSDAAPFVAAGDAGQYSDVYGRRPSIRLATNLISRLQRFDPQ